MATRTTPARAARPDRNHLVTAVAAAFDVLELFGRTRGPLAFTDIVRLSGKPRASVHRILSTLVNLGVLRQGEQAQYELTYKLWSIGTSAMAGRDLAAIARPHVERLVQGTGEAAHVAVLDSIDWAAYLCKVDSQQSIKVEYWVGKRVPSWRSASGRAILAFTPEAVQRLQAGPEPAGSEPGESLRALRKVMANGYALTKGDNHPELGGIAAPVRDHTGQVVASCGIAVPVYRMNRTFVDRCVPPVLAAAAALSTELGFRGDAHDRASGNAFGAMLKRL